MSGERSTAGESAREVARKAREKAERLERRAEMFERGAIGEERTAAVLRALPAGWTVLHDLRWPQRQLANIDHVVVGPGGIFVIDSKNWSGRVTARGGRLRQNGYSRDKAVAAAADSALAVANLVAPYAGQVVPVLCFVDQPEVDGVCGEVLVCSTDSLVRTLRSLPVTLGPMEAADACLRLDVQMASASAPGRFPYRPTPPPVQVAAPRSHPATRPTARTRRTGRRTTVAILMAVGLVTVGPSLAATAGQVISSVVVSSTRP